jgi:hypothetical protein
MEGVKIPSNNIQIPEKFQISKIMDGWLGIQSGNGNSVGSGLG